MKKSAKPPSTVILHISKVHLYQLLNWHSQFRLNSKQPPTATTSPGDLLQYQKQKPRHQCLTQICPTATQSLVYQENDANKDLAKMIYSQTPNKFGEEAVKQNIEYDSYQGPITRLLFTTYSDSDKASYQ